MANIHDTTNFRALSLDLTEDLAPDAVSQTTSRPKSHLWQSLKHSSFLALWGASLLSNIGTWIQNAAQAWMVYKLTHSSFFLGLDALLTLAPIFLFSFVSGVVVDQYDRRKVLLYAQCLQYLCALLMTILFFSENAALWHILALSFISGVGQAFANVAYVSLIPQYVPTRDLLNATALNSLQLSLARVIGPAMAGVILHYLSPGVCYGLNAASFFFMILVVAVLREPPKKSPPKSIFAGMTGQLVNPHRQLNLAQLVKTQLKQVKVYVSRRRGLWEICILCFVTTFLGSGVQTLLPSFVRERLKGDATLFTLLMTVYGVGTMLSSLYAARHPKPVGGGNRIVYLLCSVGVSLVALSQMQFSGGAIVCAFCVGACLIGALCQYTALVQFGLVDEVRGRVMSLFLFVFHGGFALGGFTSGSLAAIFTSSSALLTSGIALFALGIAVRSTPMRIRET